MGPQDQAACIAPPVAIDVGAASVAASRAVTVLPTVAATANYIIPASWRGRTITVRAEGLDIYFAMGGDAVAVDETAVCTVGSNAITYVANCCWLIPAGTEQTFYVPPATDATVTRFAMKSSGTTGKLRAYMSTGVFPG